MSILDTKQAFFSNIVYGWSYTTFQKLLEWLKEDAVEWPQILKLITYLTVRDPEPLFSNMAMTLDFLVYV